MNDRAAKDEARLFLDRVCAGAAPDATSKQITEALRVLGDVDERVAPLQITSPSGAWQMTGAADLDPPTPFRGLGR